MKQAEAEKEVARINAEQAIIKAEAEAEAKRIAAEAEAEANKKIAESITDKLIEKTYADNWDGKLPEVVGSDTTILKGIG
jgi:uncharacterized membrane protein YqiK